MDESENLLLELYQKLNHLKKVERDLLLTTKSDVCENISEENLNEYVDSLQSEVNEISTEKEIQELAIERLQIADFIHEIVYDDDDSENQKEKSFLKQLFDKRDKLSEEIMTLHKKTCTLKEEILELQQEENNIASENQVSMRSLEKKKLESVERNENRDSEIVRKLHQRLNKKRMQARITKYIMRFLVNGSGIDWTKTAELKEFMLK